MILQYVDPGSGYAFLNMSAWLIALLAGLFGSFFFFLRGIFQFIKKHKKPLIAAIIALFLLGALLRILMDSHPAAFNKKIIVLGMDALSPEIMEPMIRQGDLPNFARLKELGSYSHLTTTNPAQSPVAWAAFATGKNPGKNGVFDFITRDPKTYGLDLVFSAMENNRPVNILKAKGFWDYTSERKIPTVVLACPDTFPARKIFGKMLSGMGVPDLLGTEGTFTFYTSERMSGTKDMGGKIVFLERALPGKENFFRADFFGPRVMGADHALKNSLVPFKLTLRNKTGAFLAYQNKTIELKVGQWSGWQGIAFKLGFLRTAKGIFKLYLIGTEPELKLYVSPINFDPREPLFQISYPENYSRELADHFGLYYTQGMPMDTWALNEKRLSERAFLQQAECIFRERKATLDLELDRLKAGVLFCYFESVDIIQHMFWRYRDPQYLLEAKDASPEYKEEIESWYKRMDAIVGDVLAKLKPEDTLIVLSDHGFASFKSAVHLNNWLMEKGYLVLNDPSRPSGAELLNGINWSRTKAYALGFGGIYINQRDRESQGIVEAGGETEALKDQIAKGLEAWVDGKYNLSVIKKVYKKENIFRGLYEKNAPDLYVGFNRGYRASWQTAIGGFGQGLIEDNLKKWSGDHLFDPSSVPGVIFSNKKILRKMPSLYDVTPTILKDSGYSDEEIEKRDFDGKPLF